jgi:hypothetical protein
MPPELGDCAVKFDVPIRSLPMATATITKQKRRRKYEDGEGRLYSELSPEAKERAREWWRDCERNDFDTDSLTEDFEEILQEDYGIEVGHSVRKTQSGKTYQIPEIYWQLSYCQGDHVSFNARIDLREFAKREENDTTKNLLEAADMLKAISFTEDDIDWHVSMGDEHYHGVSVEWECYDNTDLNLDILDEIKGSIESELSDIYKQACRRLMKLGYSEIESRDSDEYIEETIEANEYKFDEEGEFIG